MHTQPEASLLIVLRGLPDDADAGVTVPLLSHDIACEAATLELARDRGVVVEPGTHAVVRLRGVHDDADLDAALEVITYEVIPADSPALARWIEAVSD